MLDPCTCADGSCPFEAVQTKEQIIDKTPTHALFIQHYISLACWFN